jgi:hypothetical protein
LWFIMLSVVTSLDILAKKGGGFDMPPPCTLLAIVGSVSRHLSTTGSRGS